MNNNLKVIALTKGEFNKPAFCKQKHHFLTKLLETYKTSNSPEKCLRKGN